MGDFDMTWRAFVASNSENSILVHNFCEKWLPKDCDECEKARKELLDIFQQAEQNAFSGGFKAAVKLMK